MQMHWTYNPRRPSSRFWRFLAPARTQRWPSSCTFLIEVETLGESPSNTQAFRCFHKVQAPKMMREFTPFLCCLPTLLVIFLHQVAKLCSILLGTSCCKLSGESTLCQNCLANTHVVRICCIVSSWSQSIHLSGWGSPLFVSWSAVQHLFFMASQRNILYFVGAQDFQRRRRGSNWIDP